MEYTQYITLILNITNSDFSLDLLPCYNTIQKKTIQYNTVYNTITLYVA